jgi:hypothetical protein
LFVDAEHRPRREHDAQQDHPLVCDRSRIFYARYPDKCGAYLEDRDRDKENEIKKGYQPERS